jgi:hypothetical protein
MMLSFSVSFGLLRLTVGFTALMACLLAAAPE